MLKKAFPLVFLAIFTVLALPGNPRTTTQDEQQLREIETTTAKGEQQNDVSMMSFCGRLGCFRPEPRSIKTASCGKRKEQFSSSRQRPKSLHHREEEYAGPLVWGHRRCDLH